MQILQLDTEYFAFEPISPEADVYEKAEKKRIETNNAIVLLIAIEKGDDEKVANKAMSDVIEFIKKEHRDKLVIYPFAHLSDNLANPNLAMELINKMADIASKEGIDVIKAPFGWNKRFDLKLKGHPLAELSRRYTQKNVEEESNALKEESKVKSTWYIMETNGELIPVDKYDFTNHENLKKFADYEMAKVRAYQVAPPHIALMKKLGIADYEPGSDVGNLRFYPNGRLIKKLLEQYVTRSVIDYGAIEVETPIMYNYSHPALHDYLHRFPSRHYVVKSDEKEYFLRFSADFGQFLLMHDSVISYKQLPFRFYELTRYSFRREQSGEVVGLKRLRAFTMPDMHTMCMDLNMAKDEFIKQFEFSKKVLEDIGIDYNDYEAAIRFTEEFYKNNKDFIESIVKEHLKKPALIEMWNYRYAYFDPKFEFNVIDYLGKATSLSTVQMDHENGKRYEMVYIDKDGKEQYPIILHCSPSGAIERDIYALLELAAINEKNGKVPSLPLWLAPTQVRLLPISDKHIKRAEEIANLLESYEIRVDIDDIPSTLDKKIRRAEEEWVPYICVIGDAELNNDILSVRIREERKQEKMDIKTLIKTINEKTIGKPKEKLTLPRLLSKRPTFGK